MLQVARGNGKILDTDNLGGTLLVPVLVDLLYYKHPQLVSMSLNLLLRQFRFQIYFYKN